MPLRQFMKKGEPFQAADLAVMNTAFWMALDKLGLNDRNDPLVEIVGRNLVRMAMDGERDPAKLCEAAISAIGDCKSRDTDA